MQRLLPWTYDFVMKLDQPVDQLSSLQFIDYRLHIMMNMVADSLFWIIFFVEKNFQNGVFIFVFEVSWMMITVFLLPLIFQLIKSINFLSNLMFL